MIHMIHIIHLIHLIHSIIPHSLFLPQPRHHLPVRYKVLSVCLSVCRSVLPFRPSRIPASTSVFLPIPTLTYTHTDLPIHTLTHSHTHTLTHSHTQNTQTRIICTPTILREQSPPWRIRLATQEKPTERRSGDRRSRTTPFSLHFS